MTDSELEQEYAARFEQIIHDPGEWLAYADEDGSYYIQSRKLTRDQYIQARFECHPTDHFERFRAFPTRQAAKGYLVSWLKDWADEIMSSYREVKNLRLEDIK